MVMIKITTSENFSISSQYARENLYYSYCYHHHHTAFSPRLWKRGNFSVVSGVLTLWSGWDYWYSSSRLKCTQLCFVAHWYSTVFSIFLGYNIESSQSMRSKIQLQIALNSGNILFCGLEESIFWYEMTEWSAFCKISAHYIFSILKIILIFQFRFLYYQYNSSNFIYYSKYGATTVVQNLCNESLT